MTHPDFSLKQKGFTLVEIAIVMLIVTLLLTGLVPTISSQIEQRQNNETRKQLEEIQQALIGFALINGRLPCPADRTIASGQPNAGIEATTGVGPALTCTNITGTAAWGVLPWATLGVSETDAWGRRFTYRVTTIFADAIGANTVGCVPTTMPTLSSFALCSPGSISILSSVGGSNIATVIPAVVISHGLNGLGAYTPSGQPILPVPAITTDEGENIDTINTNYVSREFVQNGYDDLLTWISPNILLNRMVSAGQLP